MTEPQTSPLTPGRYGLSQSLLHPSALANPANPLFTQPGALAHVSALTGITDRQVTEPEAPEGVRAMSWQETLGKMNQMRETLIQTDIGQTLGQEWNNARLTIADSFDLRLRTMETLYSRDPGQGAMLHQEPEVARDQAPEPAPPAPAPDMDMTK